MKKVLTISLILASIISTKLSAQHTHDTPSQLSEVSRVKVLTQDLANDGLKNKEVQMVVVDFPPGGVSTAHRHPCPTFGYVLEGEIESVFEGKTYIYKKGDSFYEKTNGLHLSATNKNPVMPAKMEIVN